VLAGIVDVAAVEQFRDDRQRFAEHLVSDVGRWPPGADDVLVEVLAGAEPEGEATVGELGHYSGDLHPTCAEASAADVSGAAAGS